MPIPRRVNLLCSFIFAVYLWGGSAFAQEAPSELNRRLIQVYEQAIRSSAATNVAGGNYARTQLPDAIQAEQARLQAAGIPWIPLPDTLRLQTSPIEILVHELFRSNLTNGMPWLPLSFLPRGEALDSQNVESDIARFNAALDVRLTAAYGTLDSVQRSGWLRSWTRALPQLATDANADRIVRIRGLAVCIAQGVPWGPVACPNPVDVLLPDFMDLRLAIHQELTWTTVSQIDAFVAIRPQLNAIQRQRIAELRLLITENLQGGPSEESLCGVVGQEVLAGDCHARFRQISAIQLVQPPDMANVDLLVNGVFELGRAASRMTAVTPTSPMLQSAFTTLLRLIHVERTAIQWSDALSANVPDTTQLTRSQLLKWTVGMGLVSQSLGLIEEVEGLNRFARATDVELRQLFVLERVPSMLVAMSARLDSGVRRLIADYAQAIARYAQFAPLAARGLDQRIVRTSALLALENALRKIRHLVRLEAGNALFQLEGVVASMFAETLTPGMARGVLRFADQADPSTFDAQTIGVFPRTPADLPHVAGVISCQETGSTSHVQMLTQASQIPHVYVDCENAEGLARLRALDRQDVILAALAQPRGVVILRSFASASAVEQRVLNIYSQTASADHGPRFVLSRPSGLNVNRLLPLSELSLADRGRIAGGKACGLGALARIYGPPLVPGTVSPTGYALPFGVFAHELESAGVLRQLQETLQDSSMRGGSGSAKARRAPVLAQIRSLIRHLNISPEIRHELRLRLSNPQWIGQGVFVRSDTNAEDLPELSGAGLNATIPNVLVRQAAGVTSAPYADIEPVLTAIRDVWASPFEERAYNWRSAVIVNPWEVYPSVVVQIGIPSIKSGVMVVGATNGSDALHEILISSNFGLGITVVDGEAVPEEIRFRRNQDHLTLERTRSVSQVRYREFDRERGGTAIRPIAGSVFEGRQVLSDEEATRLARMGMEVQAYFTRLYGRAQRWDLEWGWWDGHPVLFQVRPFIGNSRFRDLHLLDPLRPREATPASLEARP